MPTDCLEDPNCYPLGTEVEVLVVFATADGTPVDPPSPEILLRDPTGVESTIGGLTSTVVGTWVGSFVGSISGTWTYRGKSASVVIGAAEHRVVIDESDFAAP